MLFAACRFQEVVGRYPKRVTVVSYDFKRRRFVELLGPALHLPLEFVGVAPGGRFDAQSAARGEATAAEAFERDPYGCEGELASKRTARNPFRRREPRRELPGPAAAPRRVRQGDGPGRGGGVRVAVARRRRALPHVRALRARDLGRSHAIDATTSKKIENRYGKTVVRNTRAPPCWGGTVRRSAVGGKNGAARFWAPRRASRTWRGLGPCARRSSTFTEQAPCALHHEDPRIRARRAAPRRPRPSGSAKTT